MLPISSLEIMLVRPSEQSRNTSPVAAGDRVGVDVDVALGPQRPRDDRPLRVVLGLARGDLPRPLQLGHQRVVAGELLELAVAQQVAAAVADVAEAHAVGADQRGGQRGAHAPARLLGLREVVDPPVGGLGDLAQLALGLRGRAVHLVEGLDGYLRGDLAGLGPAHAVGHREHGRCLDERVLVGLALAAHVAQGGALGDGQRHNYSW